MASLVRVRSGPFTLEGSRTVEEIESMTLEERIAAVTPTAALFADLPETAPGARLAKLFACGSPVPQKWIRTSFPDGTLLRVTEGGVLIGLGRVVAESGESVIRSEKLFDLSLVPPEGSSEREKKHGEHQDTSHG